MAVVSHSLRFSIFWIHYELVENRTGRHFSERRLWTLSSLIHTGSVKIRRWKKLDRNIFDPFDIYWLLFFNALYDRQYDQTLLWYLPEGNNVWTERSYLSGSFDQERQVLFGLFSKSKTLENYSRRCTKEKTCYNSINMTTRRFFFFFESSLPRVSLGA